MLIQRTIAINELRKTSFSFFTSVIYLHGKPLYETLSVVVQFKKIMKYCLRKIKMFPYLSLSIFSISMLQVLHFFKMSILLKLFGQNSCKY